MLHLMRRRRVRASLSVLCLSSLGLVACANDVGRITEVAPQAQYDGRTLYRGIVLGAGPVAEELPPIRRLMAGVKLATDPAATERLTQFHDRLIASVDALEPTFFGRFEAAMTSKNHLRIQRMLREASELTLSAILTAEENSKVRDALANREAIAQAVSERMDRLVRNDPAERAKVAEALRALYYQSGNDAGGPPLDRSMVIAEEECVVLVLVVAVVVAVIIAVVVVIAVEIEVTMAEMTASMTPLSQEELVQAIVKAY